MRDPRPGTSAPVGFPPELISDLIEAVTLSLLLRLETYGLAEPPPGLSRRMDLFVEWCGEHGSEPELGLSESL